MRRGLISQSNDSGLDILIEFLIDLGEQISFVKEYLLSDVNYFTGGNMHTIWKDKSNVLFGYVSDPHVYLSIPIDQLLLVIDKWLEIYKRPHSYLFVFQHNDVIEFQAFANELLLESKIKVLGIH